MICICHILELKCLSPLYPCNTPPPNQKHVHFPSKSSSDANAFVNLSRHLCTLEICSMLLVLAEEKVSPGPSNHDYTTKMKVTLSNGFHLKLKIVPIPPKLL